MTDFHVLRQLGISIRPSRAPKILGVLWRPPTSSWLKLNTDGSLFGALGTSRFGEKISNGKDGIVSGLSVNGEISVRLDLI
ncbi:hypothetical protein M5689_000150 [Euphorbia peplus]|nr:hypothetical protein M5689_000150 [Euphorbia peplus]